MLEETRTQFQIPVAQSHHHPHQGERQFDRVGQFLRTPTAAHQIPAVGTCALVMPRQGQQIRGSALQLLPIGCAKDPPTEAPEFRQVIHFILERLRDRLLQCAR